jgi:Pyruvate/2-oxoacid:ferredoxin oxidoreductase delta subunit
MKRDNRIFQLDEYIQKYERNKTAESETPHGKMLNILQAPYYDFRNYDEFLIALQQMLSKEEAEVWCAYPDFTITATAKTPDEVRNTLREELQPQIEELSQSLAKKNFLFEKANANGEQGYIRAYFLDIVVLYIFYPDNTALSKAILQWWMNVLEGGDSAKFRNPFSERRILPHESTLTGNNTYGRIPMNLEIPDTREVLPMDQTAEFLKVCRRYAVTDCMCRTAQDLNQSRKCNSPVKDVCFLFDEVADSAIEMGAAREITLEEVMEIIRSCRDLGMIQTVSNAQHPLSLCNCCKCCCPCVRSLTRFEFPLCEESRYLAEPAHEEVCISCNKCSSLCPGNAIKVENGIVQIRSQLCIGCGVCVSQCPKGVLKMVKRPDAANNIEQISLQRIYL